MNANETEFVERAGENPPVSENERNKESTDAQPQKATKRSLARPLGWIIGVLVVVITIVAAIFLLNHRSGGIKAAPLAEESTDAIQLSPEQQAAISVETVQPTTLQLDVSTPGKIAFNADRITPVFSQFSGRLVRLSAEVGSEVRAGDTLATVDTPDVVSAEADYQQAIANEHTARSALELAMRVRQRAERLAAAEAIAARELQQAQADEARARDDLQRALSAENAVHDRLQSLGVRQAEIDRLRKGESSVNRTVPLIAQISGTITERKAGVGQVVQASAGDPLFMIADLSSVWVNADVYEDQLSYIRVGTPVKIQTPAYPNQIFAAHVDQIGATLDPDKHTVAVRCVVPNPQRKLKPGMFTSVILASASHPTAITVPSSAVVTEGENRHVFIEQSAGHYLKRSVEVGDELNGSLVIRSGLEPGDRVVIRGGLLISEAQPNNQN